VNLLTLLLLSLTLWCQSIFQTGYNSGVAFSGVFIDFSALTNGATPTATQMLSSSHQSGSLPLGTWIIENNTSLLAGVNSIGPTSTLISPIVVAGTRYDGSGSMNLQYTTSPSTPGAYAFNRLPTSYPDMWMSFQFETNMPLTETYNDWYDIGSMQSSDNTDGIWASLLANGSALYLQMECESTSGGTTYSSGQGSPVSLPYVGTIPVIPNTQYTVLLHKATGNPAGSGSCTSGAGCNTLTLYDSYGANLGTVGCLAGVGTYPAQNIKIGVSGAEPEAAGHYLWWRNVQISAQAAPLP
jgi:hypothetical protein